MGGGGEKRRSPALLRALSSVDGPQKSWQHESERGRRSVICGEQGDEVRGYKQGGEGG